MAKKAYVGVDSIVYTPVEYIESTGTQYIDTGIVPKSTTRLVLEMALTDLTINNRCGWGSGGSQEALGCGLLNGTYTTFFGVCSANTSYVTLSTVDTNKHTYDISNSAIKQDGTSYGTGNIGNTATSDQTLYLFSYHAEWEISRAVFGKQRIYSCQIYDGETLVRDFIPVKDSNNIPCLYEKVEDKFYYNQVSGNFLAGAEGTPLVYSNAKKIKKMYIGAAMHYTPVEYIQSTGTQYIDTGFIPTNNFRIDMEIARTDLSLNDGVCGSKSSSTWGLYFYPASNGKYGCAYGTQNVYVVDNTNYNDLNKHHIVLDLNSTGLKTYVDETLISTNAYSAIENGLNYYLFKCNDGGTTRKAEIKLYSFKMYDNNELVRDFVPVKDDNNVACLFDNVENKLYYNQGAGTFTAGNETGEPVSLGIFARKIKKAYVGVPSSYTPVEYIESTGTQYINTGFKHTSNTRFLFDCDITFSTSVSWQGICGSMGNASKSASFCPENYDYPSMGTSTYFYYGGTGSLVSRSSLAGRKVWDLNKNVWTVGENSWTQSVRTFTSEFYDYIFTHTTSENGIVGRTAAKLYYFKIYENDVLVRDFIPVLDKNNVACLYDQVGNKFYYNEGTGTFTAGNVTGEQVNLGDFARLFWKKDGPLSERILQYNKGRGYSTDIASTPDRLIVAGGNSKVGYYESWTKSYVKSNTNDSNVNNEASGHTLYNATMWVVSGQSNVKIIRNDLTVVNGGTYHSTSAKYGVSACQVGDKLLFTGGVSGASNTARAYNLGGTLTTPTQMSYNRYRHAQCNFQGKACILGGGNANMDIYNSDLTKTTATGLATDYRYIQSAITKNYMICGQYNVAEVAVFNTSLVRLMQLPIPTALSANCAAFNDNDGEYMCFLNDGKHYYITDNLVVHTLETNNTFSSSDTVATPWLENRVAVAGQNQAEIFEV